MTRSRCKPRPFRAARHARLAGCRAGGTWSRLIASAALALVPVQAPATAPPCGDALGNGVARGESKGYVVAWRADPSPIVVSRHFALDVVVCAKPGAAAPRSLAVDATMPAHRHGMNYRPTIAARGEGRYRAEGLMFHMPGAWEFAFDVTGGGGTERVRILYELR